MGNFRWQYNCFNWSIYFLNGQEWKENALSKNNFRTYDIIDSDINNDGKVDVLEANTGEYNLYYINK